MKVTTEQQYHILIRNVLPLLESLVSGYTYDPGSSDLDNEQPIHVIMTLGEYRKASNLVYELRKA